MTASTTITYSYIVYKETATVDIAQVEWLQFGIHYI